MNLLKYPSRLLEDAVNEFARLPGIGRKTALRLVLHLLRADKEEVRRFGTSLIRLREEIRHCSSCNNISDTEVCNICADPKRDLPCTGGHHFPDGRYRAGRSGNK